MIQAAYIPEVNYVELFPDAGTATSPLKPNWTTMNHFSNRFEPVRTNSNQFEVRDTTAVMRGNKRFYVVNHTTEYSSWP